ncbi:MAG: histidine kinase [Proteobacteria bacterium]|nr:histidine kinase [Pseudomonadota bacterium]
MTPSAFALQARSLAWHGLFTLAFCLLLAALLTALGLGAWRDNMAYSVPIGLISWLVIDLDRLAWANDHDIPWPAGWRGPVLVAAGIGLGWLLGSALGDWWLFGRLGWSNGKWLLSLLITVLASVTASVFFFQRGKARYLQAHMAQAQRDAAEARLKLLETQLEPHMLFNTLANLRVLVAADPARAQAMLDHFIAYLRATLAASRATLHPLEGEFARLADYLELMAMRMGPRLSYALDLPEPLRDVPVPPLLLQPLVENAIRHGLEPQVAGGRIEVQARLLQATGRAASVRIEVHDTGAGPGAGAPGGTQFGLQQVRERLATLYGAAGTLELIADSAGGTTAIVTFPLISGIPRTPLPTHRHPREGGDPGHSAEPGCPPARA